MKPKIILLSLVLTAVNINSQNVLRHDATSATSSVETALPEIATDSLSSINTDRLFNSNGIKIKAFDKKASDNKESFTITNTTQFNLSRIELLLRYSDHDGNMIHERKELIECELPSGMSRQIYIAAFDKQHNYYYYKSTKPRKKATPFRAAFKLLRYDIIAK
ncbi:MAG: hypothetical protein PHR45_07570 [Muribaculaceae bacterium]|nr:hypothetical protein [Muribaculaceae bacterium]